MGRGAELEHIVSSSAPGRVVSIHTIDGMAGIGKTALAVRAAHHLAPNFPDGQYFVELHAHTPGQTPAEPVEVLARLLIDVGVDPSLLPESLEGRRDLWRDRTAGKRMLLVLDDARDHAHVEPLLPATGGCLTLITSRRHLTALDGAVDLPLDTLEPEAAAELFVVLARRPTITGSERDAVQQIVRLCGYLPLAIVLLAGRLAHHRSWSIAELAADFSATQDRLDELEAGPRSVQAAFAMSYQDLPPGQQHIFRCLGLHPGSNFDAPAAAALAGVTEETARKQLIALYTDHFIEETRPGRYRLHDLLRAYARDRADAGSVEDNAEALLRLFDYYQATAAAADLHLARRTQPTNESLPGESRAGEHRDEVQALKWLRSERDNLLACIDSALAYQPQRSIRLTESLASLLERDGPLRQAEHLHRRALHTARRIGNRLGEANALANLGDTLEVDGEYTEAVDLHQQALRLYRELGHRVGEANGLFALGYMSRLTGDSAAALALLQQAVSLYREIGHQRGEANASMLWGLVCKETGAYAEATELYRNALTLFCEAGNQRGEAFTLNNLGDLLKHTGDYEKASELLQRALALFRELGYQIGQAEALTELGSVQHLTGDHAAAIEFHEQALDLHRQMGYRSGEIYVLIRLGAMYRLSGDYAKSRDLHETALASTREIGNRRLETEALNHLGTLLLELGDPQAALATFTEALSLAQSVLSQQEQAHSLEGAARSEAALGNTATAATQLRHAVHIYRQLASPEAGPAAEYLSQVESSLPLRER
ncbi:ATP-binding protein [Nocardia testacea]|uniref:ATP-binding protein n=1 Tax=Nocardia testacea TaxID=248551 RepID=UPI003C2F1651